MASYSHNSFSLSLSGLLCLSPQIGVDFVGDWIYLTALHQTIDSLSNLGGGHQTKAFPLSDVLYDPILLHT